MLTSEVVDSIIYTATVDVLADTLVNSVHQEIPDFLAKFCTAVSFYTNAGARSLISLDDIQLALRDQLLPQLALEINTDDLMQSIHDHKATRRFFQLDERDRSIMAQFTDAGRKNVNVYDLEMDDDDHHHNDTDGVDNQDGQDNHQLKVDVERVHSCARAWLAELQSLDSKNVNVDAEEVKRKRKALVAVPLPEYIPKFLGGYPEKHTYVRTEVPPESTRKDSARPPFPPAPLSSFKQHLEQRIEQDQQQQQQQPKEMLKISRALQSLFQIERRKFERLRKKQQDQQRQVPDSEENEHAHTLLLADIVNYESHIDRED